MLRGSVESEEMKIFFAASGALCFCGCDGITVDWSQHLPVSCGSCQLRQAREDVVKIGPQGGAVRDRQQALTMSVQAGAVLPNGGSNGAHSHKHQHTEKTSLMKQAQQAYTMNDVEASR